MVSRKGCEADQEQLVQHTERQGESQWSVRLQKGSKFSEMCKAYGDRYEKAALRSVQTFLNPSGLRIEEAKFYIPQSHPFLGATPDGIIVKDNEIDSVVEVKCPYNSRWTGQRPKWIQLKRNGTYGLEPERRYWYQVQAQMFVTGAGQCVFGVFTPKNDMDHSGAKGPTVY